MVKKPVKSIKENLFDYTDYRKFLFDFFQEQKHVKPHFSHRFFARKAGFSSPSYFSEVVEGKYNLTPKTLPKMISGLGLNKLQKEFFIALVHYNQSSESQKKLKYQRILDAIREKSETYKLGGDQVQYVKEWYFQVIRELAISTDWQGDFQKLGSMVDPPISGNKAKKALTILCNLGLLEKVSKGHYRQTNLSLSTEKIPPSAMLKARREVLEHGIASLDRYPPNERYLAYTTASVSHECYKAIKDLMEETRAKALEMVLADQNPERVCEIVFQLFPISKSYNLASNLDKKEADS